MIDLRLGDCLEILKDIPDKSIDAIITDLPYGTTACKWDAIIPFEPMWEQVKRICKGAFVTTASQPFTSKLVMSNLDWFKYEWVWEKGKATGHLDARRKPLKAHENICVFSENGHSYIPQLSKGKPYKNNHKPGDCGDVYGDVNKYSFDNNGIRFPRSVIRFTHETSPEHPTQKPISLYEYLIKTYTNEGDTVLDMTMGSGTTGVACVQTGRNFIGIEIDPTYFAIAEKRIHEAQQQPSLLEAN
jgi:site-specific DNA-methyltransferase (adenine-specific)